MADSGVLSPVRGHRSPTGRPSRSPLPGSARMGSPGIRTSPGCQQLVTMSPNIDYIKPIVKSAVKRWKRLHEQHMFRRLTDLRLEKKSRTQQSREEAKKQVRKIPMEALAHEWFSEQKATVETRAYLVDKVLPTLVLGVEKLLTEVDKKGLCEGSGADANFNPVNYLAQYLMRNNPRYSNFSEASPYTRGLREVSEQLKKELFSIEDNKLARIKAEAKRKREEREREEEYKKIENERREQALAKQFLEWNVGLDGRVDVSLLQNALRSFTEITERYPVELQKAARFSQRVGPTDETGRSLSQKNFKEFIGQFIGNMSSEVFDHFMIHLSTCALAYRAAAEMEGRRFQLTNLFMSCDLSGVGLLDRHRILSLFESYYDNAKETIKETLRNPRKWPVIEVDEEDSVCDENSETGDPEGKQSSLFNEQQDVSQQSLEKTEQDADRQDKQADVLTVVRSDTTAELKAKESAELHVAESDVSLGVKASEASVVYELDAQGDVQLPSPPPTADKPPPTRASVTFAAGTKILDHEEMGRATLMSRGTGSMSQASAFDESSLNVSQFVQLTETYIGDEPNLDAFNGLVKFIKDGYMETEEEKRERLLRAHKEHVVTKRKVRVDYLFEKWDNDGSGYLDIEEVETIITKYKDGMERETMEKAKNTVRSKNKANDNRFSKREFREFITCVSEEIPGGDEFDYLVDFLENSVERSYADRVRGEARKKWLLQIVTAAETSGATMEPVYRAVFQALYKDSETHGNNKKISANIALLETNDIDPTRGEMMLTYVATTPEDAHFLLNQVLFTDMKGISFSSIESGKPIHVPRVTNHGNIHFWNPHRLAEEREGSFIIVPLKDQKKRVFGTLGVDTLCDPHTKAIFITHELQYFQGVAKCFSIAFHHVDNRRKTMRITESAISWIHRRSSNVREITVYMVEPDGKNIDYVLRRMMSTDEKGEAQVMAKPTRLERKDNLFRDYLFKCVDNSETVTADAYGQRHFAFPLRDADGMAVAVVDISTGDIKKLPRHEEKEVHRMLKLLQVAQKEVTKESAGGDKTQVLEAEKHEDTRVDVMFDRLMLMDLREHVANLDTRAYAEMKSYKDPPKVIHNIIKAVLSIFYTEQVDAGEFDDWSACKVYLNNDLNSKIAKYDPTSSKPLVPAEKITKHLDGVPHGSVGKHSSIPATHFYNWVFVCLSLIQHSTKMAENKQKGSLPQMKKEKTDREKTNT